MEKSKDVYKMGYGMVAFAKREKKEEETLF